MKISCESENITGIAIQPYLSFSIVYRSCVRFDISSYSSRHTVMKLGHAVKIYAWSNIVNHRRTICSCERLGRENADTTLFSRHISRVRLISRSRRKVVFARNLISRN